MTVLLTRYRKALTRPGMPRMMSALLVACLLTGMMNLALLLAVEAATDSYARAGTVAGCFAGGLAIGAPAWGRAVDRLGPRRPLAWAATAQLTMVAIFLATANASNATLPLAVTASLVGASTPPYAAVTKRVMMTTSDTSSRRTLFAMSGFFTECVLVIGPLAVAVIVVVAGPLWAVLVAATASVTGSLAMRGCAPVRDLDRARSSGHLGRRASPAGWNLKQLWILAVITLGAFAIGSLQVSIVAHAQALSASEGILVAAVAAGGVVASFLYGGLHLHGSLRTHLAASLGLYGLLILTLLWSPGLLASVALLILIGAATGPADAVEALLVGHYTPAEAHAQAFATVVTANWIGVGVGSALGGALVEDVALATGVVVAGAGALAAASLTLFPVPAPAPAQHPGT